jgi:hypothetical protein
MRFLLTLSLCAFSISALAADVTGKWNVTAKDPEGR